MGHIKQLELFSDTPAAQPAPVPVPAPRPSPSESAIPTACPPSLPPGARWREVRAPEQPIGFVLQRSRRKSIGLTINDDGLQVTAPNWVTLGQIDAAVIEKSAWVLGKLRLRQARQQQLATADTLWQHGGQIPYLGKRIVLALDDTQKTPVFTGSPFSPRDGDPLCLALPANAGRSRIRDSVHSWLQQQALAWFELRLQHFLAVSGLSIRRWRLSSAATRWGSCSSDGNIMLNWRLIHFEPDIIDYVIAHEIAHLRVMNHSKDFWREVGRILPGFERARDALRQHDPGSLPLI
ncbi:SprT family zinc-dependent metalloprotease [Pusillimonas sp. SM2304]|uniref:M48 family metallopeptidase n=1 Tax=Pusillimonas sp. SM2304 TaxID=3073241 RepID=UPI002873FC85|nr:SprT family zinc-dependent metalloprotease [Pusillimonas sp. SM2304]MDS1142557.1 SprT family zinc-dependent metalloprotease [Pusillimonas sp. SM2304]